VDGVLQFFTTLGESLLERLQRLAPDARLVKAFSCVGSALMVNPQLPGGKPTMFICGADAGAKRQVAAVLDEFGWEVEGRRPGRSVPSSGLRRCGEVETSPSASSASRKRVTLRAARDL
jgi:hypothetical protein